MTESWMRLDEEKKKKVWNLGEKPVNKSHDVNERRLGGD